jgi:hypothetical protein
VTSNGFLVVAINHNKSRLADIKKVTMHGKLVYFTHAVKEDTMVNKITPYSSTANTINLHDRALLPF